MAVATIEKLNIFNYANLFTDIKCVLIEKGLWDIIKNSVERLKQTDKVTKDDVKSFNQHSGQALSVNILKCRN